MIVVCNKCGKKYERFNSGGYQEDDIMKGRYLEHKSKKRNKHLNIQKHALLSRFPDEAERYYGCGYDDNLSIGETSLSVDDKALLDKKHENFGKMIILCIFLIIILLIIIISEVLIR